MTATVVVVGSINVDLTTHLERLPGPGETVSGGEFARSHGGKGANQAVAAARLGARAVIVGMVGDDDLGQAARAELAGEGVSVAEVATGRSHTGVAQILVDASGENLIAVSPGANREVTSDMVVEALAGIDADDAVVVAVLEVPLDAVTAAARVARERGWRFVLNPAPARSLTDELIPLCDVLTPNQHEVGRLGRPSVEGLLDAGAGALVVTMGAAGAELSRAGRAPHRQAGFVVDVVDTTGAGDAFSGALATSLAGGSDLEAAVEAAAGAGALATTRLGARAGMPSRTELDALLGRASHGERGVQPQGVAADSPNGGRR